MNELSLIINLCSDWKNTIYANANRKTEANNVGGGLLSDLIVVGLNVHKASPYFDVID